MMNCDIDLKYECLVITHDDANDDGIASTIEETPSTEKEASLMIPQSQLSWGSLQECVGSFRQLGTRKRWGVVTSALRQTLKRLLT